MIANIVKFVFLMILFAAATSGCGTDVVPTAEGGERVTLKISGMT
jgi:hypothetical protein